MPSLQSGMTGWKYSFIRTAKVRLAWTCGSQHGKARLDPWSTPVNLGGAVNTIYDERFPFVSSDGETLYFTSGRPGGFGDEGTWNLYMSTRTKLRGRSDR
jgi:hypothetical protein